ncbi:76be791d-e179-4529-94c1-bd38542a11ef-CDS [Sclerotinia trifoliorum]|uniref:tRNA (adenine(58)-N(1))-methyltransferase catalytic subunit TRM61 n=1 Tax=Sclerotinia trifoliorum TaxID=28548 RepID=A0A8H2ZQY0_9HELO|nr:76be791d-e179-4529-94c1-bd38542a11ef-CDS [Sclerotinia trifoliorum]
MSTKRSPFLYPGAISSSDQLAILHLKRDLQTPTILKSTDEKDEGYAEGKVTNTRFGSFPHTTLIGIPWGTQVLASKVDTGSRGRRGDKKRKRDDVETADTPQAAELITENAEDRSSTPTSATKEVAEAVAAGSGFIHFLPPTPENWTNSLPHRTQVVYTPDYSYILHRIRARPGTSLIEAGAGSGSFTHASTRAVFSGYPDKHTTKKRKLGKVWSFEFHEPRHAKLVEELEEHGLDKLVEITHRDVCEGGFLVDGKSPKAESIFLDLPAPWLALPHLTRSPPPPIKNPNGELAPSRPISEPFVSALNPEAPVHLCTFSPCIEQVQRTISVMRQLGWVDIEMVELSAKRFEIRRERIGIDNGVQRGLQTSPANVEEAVARLLEVETGHQSFHKKGDAPGKMPRQNPNTRDTLIKSLVEGKIYKEGKLIHKTEPEVRTHTSYLVFAVLPKEWSEEDEKKAREKWEVNFNGEPEVNATKQSELPMSKRQMKKAARASHVKPATAAAPLVGDGTAIVDGANGLIKEETETNVEG